MNLDVCSAFRQRTDTRLVRSVSWSTVAFFSPVESQANSNPWSVVTSFEVAGYALVEKVGCDIPLNNLLEHFIQTCQIDNSIDPFDTGSVQTIIIVSDFGFWSQLSKYHMFHKIPSV